MALPIILHLLKCDDPNQCSTCCGYHVDTNNLSGLPALTAFSNQADGRSWLVKRGLASHQVEAINRQSNDGMRIVNQAKAEFVKGVVFYQDDNGIGIFHPL